MTVQSGGGFGWLLRRLRDEAGLTQEELAEAARVSVRAVSDLERGVNRSARRETARMLADALGLTGPARVVFEDAARGRASGDVGQLLAGSGSGPAAARTLPRDVASFTGRDRELARVFDAAARVADSGGVVGICAIGGMAGVGKTAFAVHAAHHLAREFPDGQIFLPLHGHTPGQSPVEPADGLVSLLLLAGVAAQQIPAGVEARSQMWRDHLAGKRVLLVLDDARGHEQVRPLLPGTAGSLVLVTSRRHLTALEDAVSVSLDVLPAGEAAVLLIRLADRPGLEVSDAAVADIAFLCGHLPLAIGMIARQLHHHPAWTCAAVAAQVSAARDRFAFMHAENLSVTAAFDLSYQDLTASAQMLFRRLGQHPGADFDAYAAAALGGEDLDTARLLLELLYDQYLLTEPVQGRYRLHDLIREHARALVAAHPAGDRDEASRRLLDFYLCATVSVEPHFQRRSPGIQPAAATGSSPGVPNLVARRDAATWMEAERVNLHAMVADAARQDMRAHVLALAAAVHGFLRSYGHWDQAVSMHSLALQAARAEGSQLSEALVLINLSDVRQLTGDYAAAFANVNRALELSHQLGSQPGQASALNESGVIHQVTGDYAAAARCHEQALRLYRILGSEPGEASALNELGVVRQATGKYLEAAACHEDALRLHRELGNQVGEASALNRLGLVQRTIGQYKAAAASHELALVLFQELGNQLGEAGALNGLGIVYRAFGDMKAAVASHRCALRLYRDLGYQEGQVHAFNELGTDQQVLGHYRAAIRSHKQSLGLTRALGHRRGEAHALNELGMAQQALGDYTAAAASHEQALFLHHQLHNPRGEARALTGHALVQQAFGNRQAAAENLAKALNIFRDIGAINGEAETLNFQGYLLLDSSDCRQARAVFAHALTVASRLSYTVEQTRAIQGLSQCDQLSEQAVAGSS